MATVEFESSRPALFPAVSLDRSGLRSASRGARPRLALVSTYNELCGIAAYTRSLEKLLCDVFDVTVFDLNQYLLRSNHRRVRKFGDRHIQEICREIREFDAVNLQLEHGTLGRSSHDIYRRFGRIVRASPRISVTFHTIFQSEGFDYRKYLRELVRFRFVKAAEQRSSYLRTHLLSAGIADRLRRAQRFKPVSVIVHTRRDLAQMKFVHGMRNVYDHPLSFLSDSDADDIRQAASRSKFTILDQVPNDSKLIGVFGFLGRYKGFDTVIRALHHLPKEYHLLIFGGVHPNEIRPHQTIDPVVSSLFDAGYIDTNIAERMRADPTLGAPAVSVSVDGSMRDLLIGHPKDLSQRIHFLGATSDEDFLSGMALCDTVVFPIWRLGNPPPVRFRRRSSSAAASLLRALTLFCSSSVTIATRSSFLISAITSNWPRESWRVRNSIQTRDFSPSTSKPTRRSILPPMVCRQRSGRPPSGMPAEAQAKDGCGSELAALGFSWCCSV